MANLLTCPRGHHWDPAQAGPSGGASVCPVCGAAPQTVTEMEAGTLPPRDTSAPDTMHEPPWKVLDASGFPRMFGRYRLEKQLGQGGMGSVFLARDTQLDRSVALKVPHFRPDDGPKVRDRFLHEARAAAALQHANICPLHDVGVIEGTHYLTMAFIDGKSLSAVLRSQSKPLPMLQVAALVRKLALALDEAHQQGVIHRDLKPDNIMITKRGEPVVMDFGLARRDDSSSRLTQQGTIMGTPAYMAPEQARGNLDVIGPCSDIYSLGVILYELLAGRVPFQGDTMSILTQLALDEPKPPNEFRPDVAPELTAICLKAMAKDPAARYRTMADFAAALAGYIRAARGNGAPSKEAMEQPLVEGSGGITTMLESEAAPPRRGFGWGWALVGIVLLALGGGAYWWLTNKKSDTSEDNPKPAPTADAPPVWPEGPLKEGRIPSPIAALGKELYNADFAFPQRLEGWPLGNKPRFNTRFSGGAYHLKKTVPGAPPPHVDVPLPASVDQFAFEVNGRVQSGGGWGLMVSSVSPSGRVLQVRLDRDGNLLVSSHTQEREKHSVTQDERIAHKVIKPKQEFNRILIIVREEYLEIYVNGFAVCNPVSVEPGLTPARLALFVAGGAGAEAEFKRVAVWSAKVLPSLKSRIAAVK